MVDDELEIGLRDVRALLGDANAYFYVCGLKAMEEGVVLALRDIATALYVEMLEVGYTYDAPAANALRRTEGKSTVTVPVDTATVAAATSRRSTPLRSSFAPKAT